MQRGSIYSHHGSWWLRFYDTRFVDGSPVKKPRYIKLAEESDEFPTKRSVRRLADKYLDPVNDHEGEVESAMPVAAFMENVYLPAAKSMLRPSTHRGYILLFDVYLKKRLVDIRLRDFRTKHGQSIMHNIPGVSHVSLLRIKATLSAAFTYAIRIGWIDGPNPMHGVSVPGRVKKFHGYAHSTDEIERLLIAIGSYGENVAVTKLAIGLAAFCGFRLSEIRGLRWGDFDGEYLHVKRSVWRSNVGPTKTMEAEAAVPALPILQKALNAYRLKTKFPGEHDYILAGQRRGAPLNLHNLEIRVLRPAIEKYNSDPDNANHQLKWHGWHSFRRGLATNLYELGVTPKVIQAILRHSDIGTTLQFYVQTSPQQSVEALQRIEQDFPFGL